MADLTHCHLTLPLPVGPSPAIPPSLFPTRIAHFASHFLSIWNHDSCRSARARHRDRTRWAQPQTDPFPPPAVPFARPLPPARGRLPMSNRRPSRIRPRGEDDKPNLPSSSPLTLSQSGGQSDESASAPAATAQSGGVQPLPKQMSTKQRQSPRFCSPLDRLATVELQLTLQFLDKRSKLQAARCSRHLLQAADFSFAWQGPPVAVMSRNQPQLGSLIHHSLLRHASISLDLWWDMPAVEVAEISAIPRLRQLRMTHYYSQSDHILQLPSMQGLQTLRLQCVQIYSSIFQLLPALPALHTLECCGDGLARPCPRSPI